MSAYNPFSTPLGARMNRRDEVASWEYIYMDANFISCYIALDSLEETQANATLSKWINTKCMNNWVNSALLKETGGDTSLCNLHP
jgi:hypothetical protein